MTNVKDEYPSLGQSGFGFDFLTNDYKVVRIVDLYPVNYICPKRGQRSQEDEMNPHRGKRSQVDAIYSLKNDSWRKFDDKSLSVICGIKCYSRTYTTNNNKGILSWLGNDTYAEIIASFDMNEEVMFTTPIPDDSVIGSYEETFRSLSAVNECVALIVYPLTKFYDRCWDVWVLHEYGVKKPWTNLYTVERIPGVERALGFWKNNELLLEDKLGQLFLHCPITEEKVNPSG
ncbi:F-box protein [Quillaja saponaria]|uniref:F-box protein n=1 Tax=Quillaja saponaria TaxID=32244 RepID=A0AAD7PD08_QUISA|nr:F-box protein [Quillaja saponaria]